MASSVRLTVEFISESEEARSSSCVAFDSDTGMVDVSGGPMEARQLCLAHGLIDDVREHTDLPGVKGLLDSLKEAVRESRVGPGGSGQDRDSIFARGPSPSASHGKQGP